MIPASIQTKIDGIVTLSGFGVNVLDEHRLREELIDSLIQIAVFGTNVEKPVAKWLIWEIAQTQGIHPSSIQSLYVARGRGATSTNWTIPAMNFRGLTYEVAKAVFEAGEKIGSNGFVFELARGEMGYTDQSPAEYTTTILAGAIKQGYTGPVFIQGDHFQTKCLTPGIPDKGEVEAIKELIKEALEAGFYNIDIDTSTLVDLSARDVETQQAANVKHTAILLEYIRRLEPAGITVSVGGEIGHIGGKNSTEEEFEIYMQGLSRTLPDLVSISKISLATGTEHGGKVNPDGSLAKLSVDFGLIKQVSRAARSGYQMGGAVQHGASTLDDEMLPLFPQAEAVEIHLATGFQNLIFDHPEFPDELKQRMYIWLDENQVKEKAAGMTTEQFHYKLRKKCWGQFKSELWNLPDQIKSHIRQALVDRFEFIFQQLGIAQVKALIEEHTPVQEVHKEIIDFELNQADKPEIEGLSD